MFESLGLGLGWDLTTWVCAAGITCASTTTWVYAYHYKWCLLCRSI